MPRGKKDDKKKKTKKVEDDDDNIIEEADEEEETKPNKKSGGKKKKSTSQDDDVDDLSDLDVDEEDPQNNQDEIFEGNGPAVPRKEINPKTPIGDLNIEDILSYLIQEGIKAFNPQLKYGALNLLQQLTGRRRKRPQQMNRRGGFSNRGGNFMGPPRGRGRGGMHNNGNQRGMQQQDDLYPD
jgi:hypothetical protein